MSKNISVKINNGKETVEAVKFNTAKQKVVLKAQPNVNYELVDDATQYAPEMIDTKRVGNDLYIAFEGTDINKDVDLVLEGYYEHDNTELLLGLAEDGQYYAYVPQSGVESDAVTLLAEQVFAPQALGGNSVATPFWAFNPNWLWVAAGVAAIGGIIAIVNDDGNGSSSNKNTNNSDSTNNGNKTNNGDNANNGNNTNNNGGNANNGDTTAPAKPTVEVKDNGSVEVTPPADADTKSVEVSYTDEAGTAKTATLTKGEDGTWTSNNPDVAVDPATGKATIPADKVQDGSPVKAKATDTAGNTGEEGTVNAGNNNPDTTAPSAPEVTPSTADGSVTVKVPSDAEEGDTVEVTVTPEGSDTPEKVTLTKQPDGSWTSDKPETVPSVEAGKDSTTIPEDKVKDGSEVTAQAKDPSGNESTPVKANAGNNAATPDTTAPSAPEVTPSTTDGSVTVKVPSDAEAGDTVEVTVTPEGSDTPEKVTLTKQPDGSWTSDKPETVPSVEVGKDSTTIPQDKVKDGSEVTAQAKDPSGNESTPTKANAGNNPATPDTTAPSAPEVTPSTTDGSVTVKVPSDAQTGDTVEVTVTPEGSDTPEKVTLTKNADGSWTSDKPETVPRVEAGKDSTTIPEDKVKDGSEVTAKAKDPAGNESAEAKGNAGNNADHTAPSAPEVTPSTTDGSVTVKVPGDAEVGDTVEVTVTPEGSDTPEKVTLTKQADGSWTSDKPAIVPNVDAGKNSTTIPEDKVKDGSEVTAKAKDPSGNESAEAKGNAGNNADHTAPSAPEVTPSTTDGSVTVKVPGDAEVGDTVEVTVTPEGSDTPEKVTLTKQADGSWTSDKPAIVPNVDAGKDSTTIPEDKVKDGSEVTAKAKDPAGNESAEAKGNAGNNADHTAPSAPEVTPSTEDGSVTVKVPGDAEVGDTVEVTVTPEGSDTPEKVTLTKNADGSWTSSNPTTLPNVEVGQSSTTIPQDKVKDGSPVTAQAKDPAGNESAVVSQPAGNNKVVKLELSLAQDTGASNNDNYTNNGKVNVAGIPSGSEWEYSKDGGQSWTPGSGNSFTLPNNTNVGGIAYNLQARVKGNAASTSDTLKMTLDQKAGEFHAIIDGSMNLIGTAEKNSTISINNRSGKANANGEFEFATGIASGATAKKVHYSVVETDLAGNSVSKDVAYTYYRRYAGGTKDTYGNENDVILIGTKGGTGDLGALIKSSLTTGDGDDSVYATGVQYGSNTLDMGNGNDFASFKNIGGTINMGAGNDILEGRNTDNPFFYLSQHARVDMGTGDDIVRTANTLNTRASIDGGDGFDTLQFINNNGKAFSSTLTMISNFEKIDIKGTLNNSVTISASDVEKNHSAKATVDASGKSHNNVLIVDGDAGDKVTLTGISKAASSQVTYEGNTYNVYNTGSNELWVDSDITVA